MDLTICVMLPPRGDTNFARSAHSKIPALSVVDVFPLHVVSPITALRTGYIHVRDCPAGPATVSSVLSAIDVRPVFAGREPVLNDQAKRVWEPDVSKLPERVISQLLEKRECELTWGEVVSIYRNRRDGTTLDDRFPNGRRQ